MSPTRAGTTGLVRRPAASGRWAVPIYPSLMIGLFFAIPFFLILALSVAHQNPAGYHEPGLELTHYQRFLTRIFIDTALFSVGVSALAAAGAILLGFPFTYLVTTLPRRSQVYWLVFVLSLLSLSEVLIAFSWQVMLSRTAGVSNILVWLGLLDKPVSLYPGFAGVVFSLIYLVLPFAVLILYPPLSRLAPEFAEAARTMGASPLVTFFTVVVPIMRPAIVATGITAFVFTLGAVLIPQVLGRPQHWTLSVLITDQAVYQSNIPFASALAVFLLVISMGLVGTTLWINKRYGERA